MGSSEGTTGERSSAERGFSRAGIGGGQSGGVPTASDPDGRLDGIRPRRRASGVSRLGQGRSVLVTGAGSGIGLATALCLASAGFDVVGTVRRAEQVETVGKAAAERGVSVRCVLVDVTDATGVSAAVAETAALTAGGPWAVVNNAGIAQPGAVEDVEDAQAMLQLDTNVLGPARLVRAVLPGMRQRGGGRIVNVSSVTGRVAVPYLGWYAASKHALEAVTDALRMETIGSGVAVILVRPGAVATGIWERSAARMPPGTGSRHEAAYGRADRLIDAAHGLPGPEATARTVLRALTSPRPKARYAVGRLAAVQPMIDAVLPTALTDFAKLATSGLNTVAPRELLRRARQDRRAARRGQAPGGRA